MSITSNTGVFSGIDSASLIQQLLALEARPKSTAQARIAGYQKVSAAFLDISSKTGTLRSLAQSFRTKSIFRSAKATSASETTVTATASIGAPAGQYSVTVARLASSQQVLSRGFADSTVAGLGVSQVTVEDARGRMDTDALLSDLNGGRGVQRGRIIVTDSSGTRTTVDLTRASTLNDAMEAINSAGAGRFRVAINSTGNALTLTDSAGGAGAMTVASEGTVTTAADLGLNGSGTGSVVGTRINRLGTGTRLRTLNDGLGVYISNAAGNGRFDFKVFDRNGVEHRINIGDEYNGPDGARSAVAATTVGDVINRINAQTGGAITAQLSSNGSSIELVDQTGGSGSIVVQENAGGTTAAELGILGSVAAGTLVSSSLQSELNTVSMTRLLGGTTVAPDAVTVRFRSGSSKTFNFTAQDMTGSVRNLVARFNTEMGGNATMSMDSTGTRFVLTDNTSGADEFSITGTFADAFGLTQDPTTAATIQSARTQRQWIGRNSLLSELNGGRGIGEGRMEIITSSGTTVNVNVTTSSRTVGELLDQINSSLPPATKTRARVNDTGDGILIETTDGSAATPISVRDSSGSVARNLNLAGTSTGTGAANRLDGSYERVITVTPSSTLTQVSEAINSAGVGLLASVVNDGSANPFRLSITSRNTGAAGSLTIDTGGIDLGLTTVAKARNALVFYGSDDPTRALAIESNTNSVTGAIPQVTLNLVSASTTPTSVSVTADTDAMVAEVGKFVDAFNALLSAIDSRSKYDSETRVRGALLGDSTSQELRRTLTSMIQSRGEGVNSQFSYLFEVGVSLNGEGKLELKEDKLRAAMERDPQGVADLFAGRVQEANGTQREIRDANNVVIGRVTETVAGQITTRGVFEMLSDQLELFTRSTDGKLARRTKLIDDQVKAQNARITAIDKKLASRQTILQRQFLAMEQSIGRLQSQSSSVNSLSSLRLS